MLGDITAAGELYIVTGYTDMRKSIDGLCMTCILCLRTVCLCSQAVSCRCIHLAIAIESVCVDAAPRA